MINLTYLLLFTLPVVTGTPLPLLLSLIVIGITLLGKIKPKQPYATEDISALSKEQVLIRVSELNAELQESRKANQYIMRMLEIQCARTLEQRTQLSQYLFHNSHRMRGPLARVLGIVHLFDHNAVSSHEERFLFSELKNSAVELDRQIRAGSNTLCIGLREHDLETSMASI